MKPALLTLPLLAALACKGGGCEFTPANTEAACAQACAPRKMRSFKSESGGCGVNTQCQCDDATDAGR